MRRAGSAVAIDGHCTLVDAQRLPDRIAPPPADGRGVAAERHQGEVPEYLAEQVVLKQADPPGRRRQRRGRCRLLVAPGALPADGHVPKFRRTPWRRGPRPWTSSLARCACCTTAAHAYPPSGPLEIHCPLRRDPQPPGPRPHFTAVETAQRCAAHAVCGTGRRQPLSHGGPRERQLQLYKRAT